MWVFAGEGAGLTVGGDAKFAEKVSTNARDKGPEGTFRTYAKGTTTQDSMNLSDMRKVALGRKCKITRYTNV